MASRVNRFATLGKLIRTFPNPRAVPSVDRGTSKFDALRWRKDRIAKENFFGGFSRLRVHLTFGL